MVLFKLTPRPKKNPRKTLKDKKREGDKKLSHYNLLK